jgi:hypothetical protein
MAPKAYTPGSLPHFRLLWHAPTRVATVHAVQGAGRLAWPCWWRAKQDNGVMALALQDPRVFDSLADLYASLAEDDVLCGLWRRRCTMDDTRCALSLMQHDFMEPAQYMLLDNVKRAAAGAGNFACGRLPAAWRAPCPR